MWSYLVCCELHDPERNGETIAKILAGAGAKRVYNWVWIWETDTNNARSIVEILRPALEPQDKAMACELAEDMAHSAPSVRYTIKL